MQLIFFYTKILPNGKFFGYTNKKLQILHYTNGVQSTIWYSINNPNICIKTFFLHLVIDPNRVSSCVFLDSFSLITSTRRRASWIRAISGHMNNLLANMTCTIKRLGGWLGCTGAKCCPSKQNWVERCHHSWGGWGKLIWGNIPWVLCGVCLTIEDIPRLPPNDSLSFCIAQLCDWPPKFAAKYSTNTKFSCHSTNYFCPRLFLTANRKIVLIISQTTWRFENLEASTLLFKVQLLDPKFIQSVFALHILQNKQRTGTF